MTARRKRQKPEKKSADILPTYKRDGESAVQGDMEERATEIARLAASILEDGLLEKITLSADGERILDGWHRYSALLTIYPEGIPVEEFDNIFEVFDEEVAGVSEKVFSYRKNTTRRQQNLMQRITATAHFLGIDPDARGAQAKIAEELGISRQAVSKALKTPKGEKATTKVQSIAKPKRRKPTDPMEALEFRREELEEKMEKLEEQLDELEEQLDEVDNQIKELKGDFDE